MAIRLADKLALEHPFLVAGFDDAPNEIRAAVAGALVATNTPYVGVRKPDSDAPWLQLLTVGEMPSAVTA